MKLHGHVRVGILMLAVCLSACQYDPDAGSYVTTKPADSDVVGIYQFERQYVNRSETIAGHPVIVLSADHTCEITDFPDWIAGSGIDTWKLDGSHSAKGTWSIEGVGGVDDGWGKEKTSYGIRFDDSIRFRNCNCNLTLANGKRGLCFGYGDPDSGKSMTYIRTK